MTQPSGTQPSGAAGAGRRAEPEPKPLGGSIRFEEGDFHALSDGLARDPQYNDRRLVARRKLLALGKQAAARAKADGTAFEVRSSLHQPHAFNGMTVRRLWTYLVRPKAEKKRLRGVLGADLAKDLDAAYRNAYLCLALEAERIEVSLRVHADAWFDGQNLVKRVKAEGLEGWRTHLNALDGFRLRLADWKGEWRCGSLDADRLEEFLGYYTPGDHALTVERSFPAPPGAREPACSEEAVATCLDELARLLPLYRYLAWSKDSDFLFA